MVVFSLGFIIIAFQDDLSNFAVFFLFGLTIIAVRVQKYFFFFNLFIPLSNYGGLDLANKILLQLNALHGCFERSSLVRKGLHHLLRLNKLEGVSNFGGIIDFFITGFKLSVKNVLEECIVEKEGLLHHQTKFLAQDPYVHFFHIDAIDENCAKFWVVKPHH